MKKSTLFAIYAFIALIIPISCGVLTYIICEGNVAATVVATGVGIYLSIIFLQEVIYGYEDEPETH